MDRLKESINSIKEQNVRICVCCTSKNDIYEHIKNLADITYFHKYLKLDVYCKPKTINLGVKKLVKTPYFIHSDIDLIYPETFISEIIKYTEYYCPVRVIFNNYNIGIEYKGNTYNDYKQFFNKHGDISRSLKGIAPGNGLIHLKSFKQINGYDEYYIGYGFEDADFNIRIGYICKTIELNNENVNTCHLYHKFGDNINHKKYYDDNYNYFKNKRKMLLKKIGLDEINVFNKTEHLKYIKAEK